MISYFCRYIIYLIFFTYFALSIVFTAHLYSSLKEVVWYYIEELKLFRTKFSKWHVFLDSCQGKTSCSLPKDLLASYTHPPPAWENLCSNTNASYRLFLRAGEMSDDIECPDLEDLHVNRHTEDRTCYGLTRSTLGFQEAREVCLSYGGDLLHYHDRLRTWLDGAWSGALEAGDKKTWVIGYSSTPRQLKPMIPPHLLHPATLANGSVEVCQESNCDLQHHFGICQLPPYTSDIRQTNTTYNEPCSQNICQNGGTCFTTLSGEQMCSCLPSLYGYSCENKGESNMQCSSLNSSRVAWLVAQHPENILWINY